MIIVATFATPAQADTLKNIFASRGLPCVASRNADRKRQHELRVAPEYFQQAIELLEEADCLDASPWACTPCPRCKSRKVERSIDWKNTSWITIFGGLLLLGIPLFLRRPSLHCLDCGELWREKRP